MKHIYTFYFKKINQLKLFLEKMLYYSTNDKTVMLTVKSKISSSVRNI